MILQLSQTTQILPFFVKYRTPFNRGGNRGLLPPHLETTLAPDRNSLERNIDPTRLVRDRSLHATRTMPPHDVVDHNYHTQRRPSCRDSASEDLDFLGSTLGFQSIDLNEQLEFTSCLSDTSHGTNSPTSVSRYLYEIYQSLAVHECVPDEKKRINLYQKVYVLQSERQRRLEFFPARMIDLSVDD